jgi:SAM-dependent MidA family methyltransferase
LDVERWALSAQPANPELIRLICDQIRTRGPVSFAWFMEQALYHPQHGYYSSGRCGIGRRGDYFTNVSVGSLFGRLLAAQFTEIWERMGKGDDFMIVEQGAHHAEFARDVLEAIREKSPDFFSALRYCIIEPFALLQERQSQTLAELNRKVDWRTSIDALEPFVGIHFSNELLDAMPVHLVVSKGGKGLPLARRSLGEGGSAATPWQEKFVTLKGNQFEFIEQPIVDPALQAHVKKVETASRRLSEGTRQDAASTLQMEINFAALDWIDNLSSKLQSGYVLVIDYGFSREEFYASHRSTGTLQVRAQHRLLASPFEQIGEADITAHVDWTSVAKRAEANDLSVTGFTDQHHFLTGLISELAGFAESDDSKTRRSLQTLLHPEMLGRSFQVLALAKDVDPTPALSGFKFARDARASLGL